MNEPATYIDLRKGQTILHSTSTTQRNISRASSSGDRIALIEQAGVQVEVLEHSVGVSAVPSGLLGRRGAPCLAFVYDQIIKTGVVHVQDVDLLWSTALGRSSGCS
eukprot:scaffold329623_cov22-Prasinocladus_malaysianus.AAC.1